MAQNFAIAGTLSVPSEDGQTPAKIDLATSITYTNKAAFDRSYSGAEVDDAVDLGPLDVAGAKALLIKVASGSCTVKFNGGTQAWPIGAGGYFLYCNPPQGFPTACAITTTGAALVKFLAVG